MEKEKEGSLPESLARCWHGCWCLDACWHLLLLLLSLQFCWHACWHLFWLLFCWHLLLLYWYDDWHCWYQLADAPVSSAAWVPLSSS